MYLRKQCSKIRGIHGGLFLASQTYDPLIKASRIAFFQSTFHPSFWLDDKCQTDGGLHWRESGSGSDVLERRSTLQDLDLAPIFMDLDRI